MVIAAAVVSGCGARAVSLPNPANVTAPTLAPRPADPGDSPQLGALQLRDTAGLPPGEPSAAGDLLPLAMAALRAQLPAVRDFERISVYDDNVYFTVADSAVPGRSISA